MKKLVLLTIVVLTTNLSAQVIGGRSNNEISPTISEATKLTGGGFVGDVNAFNGQFNASMPLGSVSTPSGLGFQLNLSYNNSFSMGYTQPMCSGIPYGEGWSPDIPTISVETEAFHTFLRSAECNEQDPNYNPTSPLDYGPTGSDYGATHEGDVYWFSPMVNIPGVGSGRAIFKYVDVQDDECAVFVLNKFENPIEVRYYGDNWVVISTDGKRYEFGIHASNYRAPANRRIAPYVYNGINPPAELILKEADYQPSVGPGIDPLGVKNVIEPKMQYNLWYCNSIIDVLSPGNSIWFKYEKFGEFNYFKEFSQERYGYVNANVFNTSVLNYAPDYSAYSDVLLKEVVSYVIDGKYESLELIYETVESLIGPNMIDFNDANAGQKDNLYSYEVVLEYGENGDDFTNWKKYRHAKHDRLSGSNTPQSNNPYLDASGNYHREGHNQETGMTESGDEISFSHSFLESERVLRGTDLYPGDIYELKTTIQRSNSSSLQLGNGTIDLAIVTGTNSENYPNGFEQIDYGQSPFNSSNYNATRGIEIFSTFNMALKWQMGQSEGSVETSNLFVMPNLRTASDGIHIQIGPGNSDQNFAYSPDQLSPFFTWDTYWQKDPSLGKSGAHLPHNFGIGYPWNMMAPIYKEMQSPSSGIFGGALNNEDLYETWWQSSTPSSNTNLPTKFGTETKVKEVQLIRYSKNPYMLTGVRHHRYNGELLSNNLPSPGDQIVSQKKLIYHHKDVAKVDRFPGDSQTPVPSGINRRIVLLKEIKEIPLDGNLSTPTFGVSDTSKILTTYFEYTEISGDNVDLGPQKFTQYDKYYLLSGYTDHLGGLTRVEYYPFTTQYTRHNEDYQHPMACGININASGSDFLTGSTTIFPLVHFLYKNDHSDNLLNGSGTVLKKWEYLFSNDVATPNRFKLHIDNFHGSQYARHNTGFKNVRIINPPTENGGATTYTDYEFWGAETSYTLEDYLYFGKPKSIKTYAEDGTLHEEKLFEYGHTLAFLNGYERPNFYREQLGFDHLLVRSYEYKDIYLNDEITAAGGSGPLYGDAAKMALVSKHFTGNGSANEAPKFLEFYFFNTLTTNEPDEIYFFRSYFVKTLSETSRTYDDFLYKQESISPNPPANAVARIDNPGGGTIKNPIKNDIAIDTLLISALQHEVPNWDSLLLLSSPLSDTVLFELIRDPHLTSNEKTTILGAQGGLSDLSWKNLIDNIWYFAPQNLLTLTHIQPYFSDGTQNHFIWYAQSNGSRLRGTNDVVFNHVLTKNAYITDTVTKKLCSSTVLGECFDYIISHQPQYSDDMLIRIVKSPNLTSNNLKSCLSNQYLSDDVWNEIILQSKLSNTAITQMISDREDFPSDDILINLMGRSPSLNLDQALLIFAKTDRELGTGVYDQIDSRFTASEALQIRNLLDLFVPNPIAKYCGSPVLEGRTYIENKKSYEYYEADYTGAAIGSAYEVLLGRKETAKDPSPYPFTLAGPDYGLLNEGAVIHALRLKHEPSWQVFAVESTSPHLPGAYTREEYFYLYDLQNRYDRLWFNFDLNDVRIKIQEVQDGSLLDTLCVNYAWHQDYTSYPTLPQFDGMERTRTSKNRVLAFQKASISKNTRDPKPIIRSEYYHYDRRWLFDDIPGAPEIQQFDGPECPPVTPDQPCYNSIENCSECNSIFYKPFMDIEDLTPFYFCAWFIPGQGYYVCQSGGTDWSTVYPDAQLLYCNEGLSANPNGRLPIGTLLAKLLKLKEVTVQVDVVDLGENHEFNTYRMDEENNYVAEFYMGSPNDTDADGFIAPHHMILPFDHLKVRNIKERNRYLQPQLEENQTGLQTRYYYNSTNPVWMESDDCPSDSYLSTHRNDIALPVRICVGYNRTDSLSTAYEYNDIGQTIKVTEPTGKYTEYAFDNYSRLNAVTENGTRLLNSVNYSNWEHQTQSFAARLGENYVYTEIYNSDLQDDADDYEVRKAFVDPLGREHSVVSAYKLADGSWRKIHSGSLDKDNWDRTRFAHKNHILSGSGTISPSYTTPGSDPNPYTSTLFENNPKSRPLRVADIGVDINDNEVVSYQYHITNNIFTSCELGLNLSELAKVMGPGNTSTYRFYRTLVTDQDGKKAIEYLNAFGQKVATLSYTNEIEKVVTLFVYDSYGNLAEVINPTKQSSQYKYNMLGQLYAEKTIDAGVKKYMYNKQGLVSIMQDQQLAQHLDEQSNPQPQYRVYQYDAYGKILAEGRMLVEHFPYTFSEEYGPLHYLNAFKGTAPGVPFYETYDSQDLYFDYSFSDRSTQDWLSSYDVWADQGGGNYGISQYNTIYSDISIDIIEKSYEYGTNPAQNTIGKLKRSYSYNNVGADIQRNDIYYNTEGHIAEQRIRFNPEGLGHLGNDMVSTIEYKAYNYRGSLLEELVDVESDGTVDFHCYMRYDRLNRLKEIYATPYKVNNTDQSVLLVSYTYDDATGALLNKKHHIDADGVDAIVAQIEYAYDTRMRLTEINAGQIQPGFDPLMSYQLFYDNQSPQYNTGSMVQAVNHSSNYNGNINGTLMTYNFGQGDIDNNVSGFDAPTLYGYTYDKLNRLKLADATVGDFIEDGDATGYEIGDEQLSYDKIGNIKTLIRNVRGVGVAFDPDYMEEEHWNYSYAGSSNKLSAVLGQNSYTATRNYSYDANGNLLTDPYRNIDATEYGRAAYAFELTNVDGSYQYKTKFLYSVNDQRIYKSVEEVSGTNEDYYLTDAFGKTVAIWHKDELANESWEYFVHGAEREVRIAPSEGQGLNGQANFYLNDHLGNTRVTYKAFKVDPVYETGLPDDYITTYIIKTVHDYFPYGKILREFEAGGDKRYLTTQHERDAHTGLDYRGARYYDADVARFLSLDPLAKNYPSLSDYVYVANNPIIYLDPNGKEIVDADGNVISEEQEETTDWTENHVHLNSVFASNTKSPVTDETFNGGNGDDDKKKKSKEKGDPIEYKEYGNAKSGYFKVQQADAIGFIAETGFAFVGGMSLYAGYIVDYTGEKRSFSGYSGNIGLGLEASGGFFAVFSQTDTRFTLDQFAGKGEGWDFPIIGFLSGGVDGTNGDDKYRVYSIQGGAGVNFWWSGSTTTLGE